jgi:hypothetical protein
MTNDLVITGSDDGWGDAAAEQEASTIRGTLLKFSDWNWFRGKESVKVEEGTQLVALSTRAAWVKWQDGKPAEYKMKAAGKDLPERQELGDTDESKWPLGPDKQPKDPWQNTRFVYMIDPKTAEAFTYSTSSWGGRGAVMDLGAQITRVRMARAGAMPLVELQAQPHITKYGRKSKPFFKIIEWRGDDPAPSAPPAPKQLSALTATIAENALNDDIPW